ncbi:MAG TPA: hypothetical protein VEZ11_11845 [Thermoanaerobaculia bacterium]|nr:hypothetical protein [Thermoanaerobaculia bacterium]
MATIYFSGSISGGRHDLPIYLRIVQLLEERGHRVLAGAVTSQHISAGGEGLTSEAIFERDLGWIEEVAVAGGVLVADVSLPSTGVGYEIAVARYRFNMPVICLYRPAHTLRCTAMVAGDRGITLVEYREDALAEAIDRIEAALAAGAPRSLK